jgi:hypothetical protein
VQAWRKRAKDGTLPPILAMLVRGMGGWLLLDGHVRLAAALAEGAPVPVLHLFVVTDRNGSVEPSGFAWPLPGGLVRWREEVIARLAALGRPADHALVYGLARYEAVERGRRWD